MTITGFDGKGTPFEQSDRFLTTRILARREALGRPILVGLCGAQGSGKSHTAARLVERLAAEGCSAAALSIDDFYLSQAARRDLAREVHPLLATRGVPGTHDLALGRATIAALLAARHGAVTPLPRFDKTIDDRAPEETWPQHAGPAQVVVLEGWCVGARPEPAQALAAPVNALEANEDSDGRWRTHVNGQLAGSYRDFFAMLDLTILLRASSFEQVLGWRTEQERGLVRTPGVSHPAMDDAALRRFIAHYERITRALLATEPAEIVVPLGPDRAPLEAREGER